MSRVGKDSHEQKWVLGMGRHRHSSLWSQDTRPQLRLCVAISVLWLWLYWGKHLWHHIYWIQLSYLQVCVAQTRNRVPDPWLPEMDAPLLGRSTQRVLSADLWTCREMTGESSKVLDGALLGQDWPLRGEPDVPALENVGMKKHKLWAWTGMVWFLILSLIVKWPYSSPLLFYRLFPRL